MIIRPITIEDHSKLIPFWKTNYFVNEMDSYERFKLFLKKNPGLSILAEAGGQIVGSALGSFDGRRGYLQKLVVEKKYRKQGLGQRLVSEIIKKLKSLDTLYIPINVEQEYVSFYSRCGFKKTTQVSMSLSKK